MKDRQVRCCFRHPLQLLLLRSVVFGAILQKSPANLTASSVRLLWMTSTQDYSPTPNTVMFLQNAGAISIAIREAAVAGFSVVSAKAKFVAVDIDNATSAIEQLASNVDDFDVLIGPPYSTSAIPLAYILRVMRKINIAWIATSPVLSDRTVFPNIVRVFPNFNLVAQCLLSVMPQFNWARVGVLYNPNNTIGSYLAAAMMSTLSSVARRKRNLTFTQFHTILPDTSESQIEAQLLQISTSSRVIFICGLQEPTNLARMKQLYQIMAVAHRLGMTGEDYQWISYPNGNVNTDLPPTYLPNNITIADFLATNDIKITEQQLLNAFKHFIYLYRKLSYKNDREFKERVIDAIAEAPWFMDPAKVRRDLVAMGKLPTGSVASGHLADSVRLYLLAVQQALNMGLDYRNPWVMYDIFRNITFEGYSGYFALNKDGERLPDVALHGPVADYDNQPVAALKFEEKGMMRCSLPENMRKDSSDISGVLVLDKPFVWYTSDGNPPPSFPACGYNNELRRLSTGSIIGIVIVAVAVGLLLTALVIWCIYRQKRNAELLRMDWLVPADKVQEVQYTLMSSTNSLHGNTRNGPSSINSFNNSKVAGYGSTIENLSEAGSNADVFVHNVATYNNAVVEVTEERWDGGGTSFKQYVMARRLCIIELHAMKQLSHDNISTFIGVCIRNNNLWFLHSYCSKGTLAFVLSAHSEHHGGGSVSRRHSIGPGESVSQHQQNVAGSRLEWFFKQSFFLDIAAGMEYLHSSRLGFHGRLNSDNVVVDSRWVAKLTGFGKWSFGVQHPQEKLVNLDDIGYHLLWTAPEILRQPKILSEWYDNVYGLKKADAYSFAVIMSEIIYDMPPYSHLAMSTREIINALIVKHSVSDKYKEHMLMRPLSDKELMLNSVGKEGAGVTNLVRYDGPSGTGGNVLNQDSADDTVAVEACRRLMIRCWAENMSQRPPFKEIYRQLRSQARANHGGNLVDTIIRKLELYAQNLESVVQSRTNELVDEKRRSDVLLKRLLPESVADRLKQGLPVDPQLFDVVTVYFSDIVSFTTLAGNLTPFQVVDFLNSLFVSIDDIISRYHVYKVETIGDGYMVVSGLPERIKNHAQEAASMALEIRNGMSKLTFDYLPPGERIRLRIGIHSGPVVAGIVGLTMPRYCLFGDTVNVASRMESHGEAMRIHVTEATKLLLDDGSQQYIIGERGLIHVKGKGEMTTYWVEAGFTQLGWVDAPKLD